MKQEINTLDGIFDIALPLAPADSSLGLYGNIAMIVLLSGIAIAISYYWWQQPKQRYRRELIKLLRKHHHGYINNHQTVFGLAEILRGRLNQHQLSSTTPLPKNLQDNQSRWCAFINELDAARYSAARIENAKLGILANEARFWLNRW